MKISFCKLLLVSGVVFFLCNRCAVDRHSNDPKTETGALRILEQEIELEARALMDSLFPANPSARYRSSLLELNCFPMQGDMFWLLYDEPIMLYIDDRGGWPDSIIMY